MSKFIKLLKTTLEKYGWIPSEEKGEEFNELISLFEEKEDIKEFIELIETERKSDGSSSLVRLLRAIIKESKITEYNLIEQINKFIIQEGNDEHYDATLIDIFFELKPTSKEKELLTKTILDKSDLKFPVIESLLIHVTKYYTENDILFCDVYLRALSSKRGTYLGVHWFQDAYIRIAQSHELSRFIETITSSGYEKAFELFIEGNEDTLRLFFENIAPNDENFEVIKSLLTKNNTGEDPIYILSHYHGYNQKVFLDAVFNFLSKSGKILPYIKPFLGGNYGIYETREYVGNYIHIDEVSRLGELLSEEKRWGIIPIYEYIKSHSERTDKEKILTEFEKIPGFQDEMNKTRLSREKYEQDEQERLENKNAKILAEIASVSRIDRKDTTKISPLLIDLYKKNKDLFTKKQIGFVKDHLKRFFAWELFPIDKVEFTRTHASSGSFSYSYTNNIWYREGFFLDALEIAKELNIPYPNHDKLVRALALLWIGDGAKKNLIPAIGNLTEKDIEVLGKVYDGTRTDDLFEFMGGQNFFELYRTFESDWKREKNILRIIIYKFIEKDGIEDYIRESAIKLLVNPDIWNEEKDRSLIELLWEKEIKKYPENIIENYDHKYSYLLSINQLLINLGDENAIKWRFDQLLTAKIDFPDPWENYENNGLARLVSDLESELTDDRTIIKGLECISFQDYESKFLQLYRYGLELLNENKIKFGIYGSYLLWGVIEIGKKQTNDGILQKIKAIVDSYPDGSEARRLGGYRINTIKIEKIENDGLDKGGEKAKEQLEEIEKLKKQLEKTKQDLEDEIRKKDINSRAQNWNPDNPYIVFIEGKTGVEHLKRAWKGLYPDIERKFHIANGHSSSQLSNTIDNWNDVGFELVIGIFDADDAGYKSWGSTKLRINEPRNVGDIGHWEKLLPNQETKIHGITLPIHINIGAILSKDPNLIQNLIIDAQTNTLNNLKDKRYTAIEEMYYGIAGVPEEVYDEYGRYIGVTKDNPLGWNKSNLLENLVNLTRKPDKKIESEYELFKNFIPLFKKINEIIDNHEKTKQQTSVEGVSEKSSN